MWQVGDWHILMLVLIVLRLKTRMAKLKCLSTVEGTRCPELTSENGSRKTEEDRLGP
jgi:hypothetical protein